MQYGKKSSPPQENRPRPKKETIVFQLQPSIFFHVQYAQYQGV